MELLHVRLAIVDPDPTATQPFTDARGNFTVAFNGEIYNYPELKARLGDYPFRTQSDTEVILAVYETWGLEGLRELKGMFSMAIVDSARRTVTLVRDPIGKKPLYIASWENEILFGSSVLALTACHHGATSLRRDATAAYWNGIHTRPGNSLIQGCESFYPGEVREYDWKGRLLQKTDCFPKFTEEKFSSFEEARSRGKELLALAVRRRLLDNPCKTALLSGGIDSTVVSYFLKQLAGGAAVTLGATIPLDMDEKYARYAGWRLKLPLEVLRLKLGTLGEEVRWALSLQDEPLDMISFFPLSLLLRTAKQRGKIVLTGDGGDEVFLGYGKPQDWIGSPDRETDKEFRLGAPLPTWMSAWGRQACTADLFSHNLVKLDRASAEQGIETRCPLLDWDLIAFARSLTPSQLFPTGTPKGMLKTQLERWPKMFLERPKIGFGYRLRWAWGFRGYSGLRDLVSDEASTQLAPHLPPSLRQPATKWRKRDIFRHFTDVWKALAWSAFLDRLQTAREVKSQQPAPLPIAR